ncbi:MAG: flagellar basal-body rod protein FlgF [Rhizobiales bacterium]|nr:flagellar basal-body rod protein FlgF [Hyphomicrobiales bacterium]MBI3674562.1 flagellar basal-body rod protein FlgF [Hyphomicrobiales bacterium]
METSLYVSLSGQLSLEQRLATIANNVANAGTVGFRAEGVHFDSVLSSASPVPTEFPSHGQSHAVETAGALTRSGNPLDVAIQGGGYFAIQTLAGVAYTRDGRMQVLESGELVTLNGHPVLDAGNAPIVLDPAAGPVAIGRDGMISQNGKQSAAIGLFAIDLSQPYRRYENSGLVPAQPGSPILSFTADGIVQGFVEESNVNPIREMTNLIRVTKAFESLAAAIDDSSNSYKSAIQTLAARV